MMENSFDFALALPEIVLLISAALVLLFDAFNKGENRHSTFVLSLVSLVIVACVTLWQWNADMYGTSFSGLYVVDPLSHFLKFVSYIAVAVTLIYGRGYAEDRGLLQNGGELYTLTLMALLGQMLMISAGSLLMAYLGLELMSFALYALVALRREHQASVEAAMKYFVLGALASGIFLYGMSMIYGATGTLNLGQIAAAISTGEANHLTLVFGVVFIVAGLGFKLTAAPFHMWTPDVYQGAPTTVALVIAAAPKLAAVAMALRLLIEALHGIAIDWQPMLMLLAIASLVIGNLTAIMQTNFKRMLAFSTVSHMGFIFLGFMAGVGADGLVNEDAYGASLFYAVIYVLTTLSTFGLMLVLSRQGFECENIDDFKGLNRRHPILAFVLLLSMFSLAGIPPLAGFYAKLAILQAVIGAGYISVAIVAVLMSLIGAFYYLRVVKVAYFDEPEEKNAEPLSLGWVTGGILSLNGLLVLVYGILPSGLLALCVQVIRDSLVFY
ncbi:NADH-quinone oxidoreductase subunit NuoN [Paenalcaligenes sp. Me52]|uniref:NADH-quinone oxidoreductase subunit NuoN n=1 Tax=Paenalcaligenes sp. Me52 TaxID=3392038 RepID=UPI003D2E7C5E